MEALPYEKLYENRASPVRNGRRSHRDYQLVDGYSGLR